MDSTEIELSRQDNPNNADNMMIDSINLSNNRVLIPGLNSSGSLSSDCESDERESYDEDRLSISQDGKSLNRNTSGPPDRGNFSPSSSRPSSSGRSHSHHNDNVKSERDVEMGVSDAPSRYSKDAHHRHNQNDSSVLMNGNRHSAEPSPTFPVGAGNSASVPESDSDSIVNKSGDKDSGCPRDSPFRTPHLGGPGEVDDEEESGFRDDDVRDNHYCKSNGAGDNQNQSVNCFNSSSSSSSTLATDNVRKGDVTASGDRTPPSSFSSKTHPQLGGRSPERCHDLSVTSVSPQSHSPHAHGTPFSSATSKLSASLTPAMRVTSESVGEESLLLTSSCKNNTISNNSNSNNSVKKDSKRGVQGQNEAPPGRKTAVNGPIAVARSLPIHCVIEQCPDDADDYSWTSSEEFQVVNDTYAILPGNTLFTDIVWTSLSRLNYSSEEATAATGGIQIKNWQTLDFDVITENKEATVEEMLGEIISVATLRIRLSSNVTDIPQEGVKQKLVQLLYTHSKDFLLATGCPVEKTLLDAIAKGDLSTVIAEPVCTAFSAWYNHKLKQNSSTPEMDAHGIKESKLKPHLEKYQKPTLSSSSASSIASNGTEKMDVSDTEKPLTSTPSASLSLSQTMSPLKSSLFCTTSSSSSSFKGSKKNETATINNMHFTNQSTKSERVNSKFNALPSSQSHQQENQHIKQPLLSHHHTKHDLANSVNQKVLSEYPLDRQDKMSLSNCDANLAMSFPPHSSNPYLGIMPGKTRIRTSFDPEHEIPRLQKWFSDNQHPTREQMMRFMQELNNLESRKGRRPLDLTNIIYWFKNARAAQRRASKALDDSFENEENLDVNNSGSGGGSNSGDTVPPYLPNKNAVYMIPFHPYPHLIPKSGNPCPSENGVNGPEGVSTGNGSDEPYDLSVSKRSSTDSGKSSNCNDIGSSDSGGEPTSFCHSPTTQKMSPESREDMTSNRELVKRKLSAQCPPPRFPALLDVASKMRGEIPPTSEDVYNNNSNGMCNVSSIHPGNNERNRTSSPCRPSSRSSDIDNAYKTEDLEQPYLDQTIHPRDNGFLMSSHNINALKMKCDEHRYDTDAVIPKKKKHYNLDRGSDLELGQIKKEDIPISQSNGNINCSDDDNTNDSYDSEEDLKMRMKQNVAAVADYASAMHNNVSRLTAANMAALSLAQMGQPLHIPQLAPSLAMAYYPMDPRFYSQPPVSSSLPSSSSPTPASSHLTPHQGRTTPNSLLDSPSPLPSPSSIPHSIGPHGGQHQHHHRQQQQQQQLQQQQNPRLHSEPRKRRTRVFIDPLSEIPKLEKWFKEDTHPSAFMIDKYCEELNKCEYRQKFPKLEPKNVQLWFKNHRAKVKRLKVSFNGKYEEGDEYVGEMGLDGDGDIKSENYEME